MPTAGSRERVEAELEHAFVALANGDLGDLRTAGEPSEERRPRSRRASVVAVVRALAVGAVPLGAVIGLQPVLELAAGQYHWAQIVTAGWAVVCLLMSVDPAIREKLEMVRDLISLARGEQGRGRGDSTPQDQTK